MPRSDRYNANMEQLHRFTFSRGTAKTPEQCREVQRWARDQMTVHGPDPGLIACLQDYFCEELIMLGLLDD